MIKIKHFCASKNTIKKAKQPPTEWRENVCSHLSDEGLYPEHIKNFENATIKRQLSEEIYKEFEQTFFQKEIEMANKNLKRYSTLLVRREMQITITVRYHIILISISILKKIGYIKCWPGSEGISNLKHCWLTCKIMQPLWKIVLYFL